MTACSVIERRDHRLAASKNGWVELQNKFTSNKIWNYLKSHSFVFYCLLFIVLFAISCTKPKKLFKLSWRGKTKTSLCDKITAHLPLPLTSHLGQNVGLREE